jgi:hypothetical protein
VAPYCLGVEREFAGASIWQRNNAVIRLRISEYFATTSEITNGIDLMKSGTRSDEKWHLREWNQNVKV